MAPNYHDTLGNNAVLQRFSKSRVSCNYTKGRKSKPKNLPGLKATLKKTFIKTSKQPTRSKTFLRSA